MKYTRNIYRKNNKSKYTKYVHEGVNAMTHTLSLTLAEIVLLSSCQIRLLYRYRRYA